MDKQNDRHRGDLADYLGGEMSPHERMRFEGVLAGDPELAREAADLKQAIVALRGLGDGDGDGEADQAREQPPRRVTSGSHLAGRIFKYAAVIALAFVCGLLLGGRGSERPAEQRPERVDDGASTLTTRFARAYHDRGGRADLGRSLIALARASRQSTEPSTTPPPGPASRSR